MPYSSLYWIQFLLLSQSSFTFSSLDDMYISRDPSLPSHPNQDDLTCLGNQKSQHVRILSNFTSQVFDVLKLRLTHKFQNTLTLMMGFLQYEISLPHKTSKEANHGGGVFIPLNLKPLNFKKFPRPLSHFGLRIQNTFQPARLFGRNKINWHGSPTKKKHKKYTHLDLKTSKVLPQQTNKNNTFPATKQTNKMVDLFMTSRIWSRTAAWVRIYSIHQAGLLTCKLLVAGEGGGWMKDHNFINLDSRIAFRSDVVWAVDSSRIHGCFYP